MKTMKKYYKHIFVLLTLIMSLQSCSREEPIEAIDVASSSPSSYSELFDSFWDTMNDNYNYFTEQKSWDDIYREYSPKFKALKTFNIASADKTLAQEEANLAFKYFADIVIPIKDVHFNLTVTIPIPSVNYTHKVSYSFGSKMKYKYSKKSGFIALNDFSGNPKVNPTVVSKIMRDKIISKTLYDKSPLLSGFLKSDPSTMYIQLTGFSVNEKDISANFIKILPIKKVNISENSYQELKKLDPVTEEKLIKLFNDNLDRTYTAISDILASSDYAAYLAARDIFITTENLKPLMDISDELQKSIEKSISKYKEGDKRVTKEFNKYIYDNTIDYQIKILLNNMLKEYQKLFKDMRLQSNVEKIKKTIFGRYYYADFGTSIFMSLIMGPNNIYSKLFNPLRKGNAKRIILDLRGNGGGAVLDARFFVERFITKPTVWSYQRTKEGNGRFNYTPWVEVKTTPNKFGIKNPIPIVVLIDGHSYSMSEISSMMLRSQGKRVIIMGDNSGGATAGLSKNNHAFNGGYQGGNAYLNFYMPLMAFKNSEGKIIESKGVAPDIRVIPTRQEVDNMAVTKKDIVFDAALRQIRKMN